MINRLRWLVTWRRGDLAAYRRMTADQRRIARVFAVPPRLL